MKKFLYLTVAALPLIANPVFAQDTPDTKTDSQMEQGQMDGATSTTTTTTGDTGMAAEGDMSNDTMTDGDTANDNMATDADAGTDDMATEEAAVPPSDAVVEQQQSSEMVGSWLRSTAVTSPEGDKIGDIKDFIITDDGQIEAVILSVGGFLGMGAKDIAVDYKKLDVQFDGNQIMLDMTRDQADAAPEYQYREKETPPPATGAEGDMGTSTGAETGTATQ